LNSYILAIDIGTTSSKGMAITASGEVVAVRQEYYCTDYPQPGFAEQNAEVIFRAVAKLISEILKDCSSSECLGICFSAAMHSLLAVDVNGVAITPIIIWADTRATKQSKRLKEMGVAQELYEKTGTPIHPMSPFCKLLWWKENQNHIFESTHKFVSIKEYIVFQLTGEYLVDFSTASATGFFDIEELKWSTRAQDFHGVSFAKFSKPVSIYHQVELKGQWFNDLRNRPTKLIVGSSDGCAAHVGSLALENEQLSITLGTSGAVRLARKQPLLHPHGLVFNYVLERDIFICGGASNTGTSLLDWYSEKFDPSASKKLVDFVKEIEDIEPGSGGLIALPYLHGERAPLFDPDARGVFFGVSVNHTRKHFQRALVEGICFSLKSILNLVEDAVKRSPPIQVSGGIIHSKIWLQLLSDVLGRELIVNSTQDASAIGAVMIGCKSLGIAFQQAPNQQQLFYPNKEATKIYETHFSLFESIYKQTAPLFEGLSDLRK